MSNQVEMEEALNTDGITSTQVLGRVNALVKLQEAQELLSEQMEKEILEIEKKYLAKFQPLAEKRGEIISGKVEPTEEEKAAKEPISVEGLTSKPEEKGIPNFWAQVFKNTEIAAIIDPIDDEPLTYLQDVKITPIGEESNFSLDFHFAENPFFSNSVISKTVIFNDGEFQKLESTPINWKEGKNFTVKSVKKTVKGKGKGKASAPVTKTVQEPVECFFATFLSEIETESEEEGEETMVLQFQIVSKLKDIVIPNAVDFFLGRADDSEGQDFGDYDFDGEDFDGEEDDEEDDDDEPVIKTRGAKGGKPAPPQDPNCKQQ